MVVNAARYGNGWIKVSSGSELNRAWFQVDDDGRGLNPSNVSISSSRLCVVDSARSTSGTGLGLAIVQRIIDNHNGLLEIGTSERGRFEYSRLVAGAGIAYPKQGLIRNKREAICLSLVLVK
ncbi:Osmolarity sensory histidine kinase EnvZ [Lelliottia amnigena]|nr:Osmolarity sensory histidine kinase EnvZ [Lelliottia amnigena]